MQLNPSQRNTGFTLIEVLVSVSIFAIVMLVSTGSVFTIVDSNKKAHALKSVMTNLNFALESMARDMRVGTRYGCDVVVGLIGDCSLGGDTFSYTTNRSIDADQLNDIIEYSLSNGRLMKRIHLTLSPTQPAFPVTAAEIQITHLKFYAIGSASGDGRQPKVLIIIEGNAGVGKTQSKFNIQTTVSMRSIDT